MTIGETAVKRLRDEAADIQEPESMRSIATVYWRSLLLVAALLVAASIGMGFVRFESVVGTLAPSSSTTSASVAPPFDRGQLDGVLAYFSSRAAEYQSLSQQPLSLPDPSR